MTSTIPVFEMKDSETITSSTLGSQPTGDQSVPMTPPIQERLRKLWRAVDAEGGYAGTSEARGFNYGIEHACAHLEGAGFYEGKSEAADLIDEMLAALLAIAQRANESGPPPLGFLETIHAMHDIARVAIAKAEGRS